MAPYTANTAHDMKVVMDFLEDNEQVFLKEWEESIFIYKDDVFKEKVKENGYLMYELVKKTLLDSLAEENVKELAFKVAKERIEADINIGDFVYNVNFGRSIIINYIIKSGIANKGLSEMIQKVNSQFDMFCSYAVRKYIEIKDNELMEKNSFIQQSHKDRLTILGQISSSFVHEFRNPLTSIIGFNKLLRKEFHSHRYLDIIDHELDQLNFRITQFLHTSKIDVIEIKQEKVNISELLDEILSFLYPSIVDGDVNVTTSFEDGLIKVANSEELRQVFLNILFNSIDAVKLLESSREITICCLKEKEKIKICIKNNGPAIPLSVQETIFEPFYTTKEQGTGIGLFVCKKIIETYNGKISCVSNEIETIFSIEL